MKKSDQELVLGLALGAAIVYGILGVGANLGRGAFIGRNQNDDDKL